MPGDPDTLVVGGSTATDRGQEWSFAAFNELDGPVSALRTSRAGDPDRRPGRRRGRGRRDGRRGQRGRHAHGLRPRARRHGRPQHRHGAGARRRREALRPRARARAARSSSCCAASARAADAYGVTNNGPRAAARARCACRRRTRWPRGPGGDRARSARASRSRARSTSPTGPAFPPDDPLALTLTAPDDAQLGDNVARVRVTFSFCDLQLTVRHGSRAVLGTEGARRHRFALRNLGTAPCPPRRLFTTSPGRRLGCSRRSDRRRAAASRTSSTSACVRGTRSGRARAAAVQRRDSRTCAMATTAPATAPRIVRPGDTNARKPSGGRDLPRLRAARHGRGVKKTAQGQARGDRRAAQRQRLPLAVLDRGRPADRRRGSTGAATSRCGCKATGTKGWRIAPQAARRALHAVLARRAGQRRAPRRASRAPTTRGSRSASADRARGSGRWRPLPEAR